MNERGRFTRVAPVLSDVSTAFEMETRKLAQAADRILRKHGRGIIGKQLASRRLADIMIDLFVFAAVLSRVTTGLEQKGEAAMEKELAIVRAFAFQARTRIQLNFDHIDENEDELVKALSDHAVASEGYPWDIL